MDRLLTDRKLEKLLGIEFKNTYSGHIAEYQVVAFESQRETLKAVGEWLRSRIIRTGYIDTGNEFLGNYEFWLTHEELERMEQGKDPIVLERDAPKREAK